MATITPPPPLKLEELKGKAEELYRNLHEYSQPVPEIIPIPQGEVDPEAVDHIASQAMARYVSCIHIVMLQRLMRIVFISQKGTQIL